MDAALTCRDEGKANILDGTVNSRMSRHSAHPRHLLLCLAREHGRLQGAGARAVALAGVYPNPRSGPLDTVDVFCLCAYTIDDRRS